MPAAPGAKCGCREVPPADAALGTATIAETHSSAIANRFFMLEPRSS
jgi:hypothetical protein